MVATLAVLASVAVILMAVSTGGRWLVQQILSLIRILRSRRRKLEKLQAEVADLRRQLRQRGPGKQRSAQAGGRRNGKPRIERGAPFQVAPANGMVAIRSTNKSGGPVLKCTLAQWRDFLERVKRGEFDDPR